MTGGRVGGLALEHLFEVMKLTSWCVVGMITPICEEWGWFGFGVVNWSGGEKFNAHTVGLVGLLYESGAEVGVKEVGGTSERWVLGGVSVLVPCAVKMRSEVEGCSLWCWAYMRFGVSWCCDMCWMYRTRPPVTAVWLLCACGGESTCGCLLRGGRAGSCCRGNRRLRVLL